MNEVRRSPEQIEEEISQIRAQIDHTLDAVQEKLSPGELLDQALTYVKDETGVFAGNFGRAVRDNPIPATLLGISIAWLAFASRSEPRAPYAYRAERWSDDADGRDLSWKREELMRKGEALAERAGDTAADVRQRASDLADRASATASDARARASAAATGVAERTGALKERAVHLADDAADRLWAVGARARAGWESTRREVMHGGMTAADVVKSNPLAVIALGLAAGAVAAALLPRTAREDALMGEQRDALVDDVTEAVSSAAAPVVAAAKDGIEDTTAAAARAIEQTAGAVEQAAEEDQTRAEGDTTGDAAPSPLPLGPRPVAT